jgi:hypothetical protein
MMSRADAFAQVYPAAKDLSMSMQEIADERTTLQDRIDELSMTREQLLAKERAALHDTNRPLWDRIKALESEADAVEKATAAAQAAQQVAAGLLSDIDSAFTVLQRVIDREKAALQSQVASHTEAANKIRAVSNSLRSTIDSMRDPGEQAADRVSSQRDLKSYLSTALSSGVLPDSDKLQATLGILAQDSSSQFASFADFQRDFYITRNDMSELATLSDTALTVEERSLQTLEDQLTAYDKMLEREQNQIDLLKGISTIGLSIEQAVLTLRGSMQTAAANPVVAAGSAINDAYKTHLGRAPDAAGLEYWKGAAAGGMPVSEIVGGIANSTEADLSKLYQSVLGRPPDAAGLAFFAASYGPTMDAAEKADFLKSAQNSDEYKKSKVPGYAAGGDHAGGWRIVGENGPELEATGPARIFNATQTNGLMRSLASPQENNMALLTELRLLRQQVERLEAAAVSTAENTGQVADQFDNVTDGGNAMRSEVLPWQQVQG